MHRIDVLYRLWMVLTLMALIGVPIGTVAGGLSSLRAVCFDIADLRFTSLQAPPSQQPLDPLQLLADRLHSGHVTVCTNDDSDSRSQLEAQWNRLLSLTVVLHSPGQPALTATPSNARDPYDFYALATHEARLAVIHDIFTEVVLMQAVVLTLAGLGWCGLHRLFRR
jgi:hypothetical protein